MFLPGLALEVRGGRARRELVSAAVDQSTAVSR